MLTSLQQQHPLYTLWAPTWRRLSDVYEGAGGFLDGTYLVPHPRELAYKTVRADDGTLKVDPTQIAGETQRFKRRKQLARYEHFGSIVIDTLIDYLAVRQPTRTIATETTDAPHPLRLWWENVDGHKTHIDDWMKRQQVLAAVFGHVFVAVDRPEQPEAPRSRADQVQPILRVYTPLDAPDWIASDGKLSAIKFLEAVERRSLAESPIASAVAVDGAQGDGARVGVNYRVWDDTSWALYDSGGAVLASGQHEMGEVPVVPLYGRQRATVQVVGRSVLGDPKLYIDHYNLLSEQRSIERDQTFSVLNIPLKDDQQLEDAQALAGNTMGTSNVMFTRLPASYIEPGTGPAEHYMSALGSLERKIFRLIGLPWEGDSAQAETAVSRKLKAKDLMRLLAGMADEAERMEYQVARLWFVAMGGAKAGAEAFEAAGVQIRYPDDFMEADVLEVVEQIQAKLSVPLGRTATRLLKRDAVTTLLPDLAEEDRQAIDEELEADEATAEDALASFRDSLTQARGQQAPAEEPDAEEAQAPAIRPVPMPMQTPAGEMSA